MGRRWVGGLDGAGDEVTRKNCGTVMGVKKGRLAWSTSLTHEWNCLCPTPISSIKSFDSHHIVRSPQTTTLLYRISHPVLPR